MLASLFSLDTTRSNGWVLWTRTAFNWILSVRENCSRALFYWTLWDQILCTIKKKTNRQTDIEGWREIEITRSTSTLQGMNHLTVSVTLPFLSPHPIDLSSSLCRWVALQILSVVKYTKSLRKQDDDMRQARQFLFLFYSFYLCLPLWLVHFI